MLTIEVTITDDQEVLWRATDHDEVSVSGRGYYDPRGDRDTLLDSLREAHYKFLVDKNHMNRGSF